MDIDTLDATQAIYHDEFDDETDEDLTGSQKKPVSKPGGSLHYSGNNPGGL